MTYVRLDDKMPEHPKVVGLSDKAFRLHVQGLCYCQRNLTDGIVPGPIGEMWGLKGVRELVARGLWIERGEDYEIDNFLEWNDSKAYVEEKRVKDSSRKAKGIQTDSERNPNGIQMESATIPNGFPIDIDTAGVLVRCSNSKELFDAFYDHVYPRKAGRARAWPAFERACRRADPRAILAGAQRYRDDPNREDQFTAHPTTWLNRDGWNDDPEPARKGRSVRHDDRAAEILREARREQAAG